MNLWEPQAQFGLKPSRTQGPLSMAGLKPRPYFFLWDWVFRNFVCSAIRLFSYSFKIFAAWRLCEKSNSGIGFSVIRSFGYSFKNFVLLCGETWRNFVVKIFATLRLCVKSTSGIGFSVIRNFGCSSIR